MKIGLIINGLGGGGAEKALIVFIRYLVNETEHEVLLVTLEEGQHAYELPSGIEHCVLRTGQLNRGFGRIASLPLQAFEIAKLFHEKRVDVGMSYLLRSNAANSSHRPL